MLYHRITSGLCGLYCLKNKENEILYIGKADDIYKRLMSHQHLPEECYNEIDRIDYAIINNKADRDILELLLIFQCKPKYNTQLQYNQSPSLLISSDVMLIWHTDLDTERYHFKHKEKHTGKNGRPKIIMPNNFNEYYKQWKTNNITAAECMRSMGLTNSTFYRMVKKYEKQNNIPHDNTVPSSQETA